MVIIGAVEEATEGVGEAEGEEAPVSSNLPTEIPLVKVLATLVAVVVVLAYSLSLFRRTRPFFRSFKREHSHRQNGYTR